MGFLEGDWIMRCNIHQWVNSLVNSLLDVMLGGKAGWKECVLRVLLGKVCPLPGSSLYSLLPVHHNVNSLLSTMLLCHNISALGPADCELKI